MKTIQSYCRLTFLAFFLALAGGVTTTATAQQTPSLSTVNDELENQTTEVARTAKIIARILAIIATVLLLANLVFQKVEQSKAIVGWFIIIFVWGMIEILF